jgi:hypothetical protein
MLHHLKKPGKGFGLVVLSCVLLAFGLVGLSQQTPIAHAASVHTVRTTLPGQAQICKPPVCIPFPFHDLYVFTSYAIWGHNGVASDLIDNNQIGMTNGTMVSNQFGPLTAVLARGNNVYEWRQQLVGQQVQNFLFAIVFGGCTTPTGYCLTELDNHFTTFSAAVGTNKLYQIRTDGTVWQSNGFCLGCWTEIDTHGGSLLADSHLYQVRSDRTIWRYNGIPFNWTEVASNPTVNDVSLAIDTNGVVYELPQVLKNGEVVSSSVLEGFGPFNFQPLDTVDVTGKIVADSRLYQVRSGGSILIYQGGTSWGSVWSANSQTRDVEPGAASDAVYQSFSDNSVWEFTPEAGIVEISNPFPDLVQMSRPEVAFFAL